MMHKGKKNSLRVILLSAYMAAGVLLIGCGKAAEQQETSTQQIRIENLDARDTDISPELDFAYSMELEYADKFAVDYYEDDYVLLSVADGSRMLLVPENESVPEELEAGITVLRRPICNVYLVATAVMDMFCELDVLSYVRFSGQKAEGWSRKEARTAMEQGDILYAGKYNIPDYELILSEGCSLAIENTMISHSPEVVEKLAGFGIPVMIDYSSYEEHPLGRVEWIKFYGALLGMEEQAQEIFAEQTVIVERVTAEEASGKTVAFFYITTNGMVNVRRSADYVPKMIELAGGTYIFEDLGSDLTYKSSINMQTEEFYRTAKDADYLIYNSTRDKELTTVAQLIDKCELLADFKAVQEGNVWCTTNDMYQQSMAAGEMISDLHAMISQDVSQQETMQYIYRLK